jgi:hypothetical protein
VHEIKQTAAGYGTSLDGKVVLRRGACPFQLVRHRRKEPQAFLCAFDLLELNETDLRREPSRCAGDAGQHPRKSRPGVCLNEHLEHPEGAVVFQHACKMGRGDCF